MRVSSNTVTSRLLQQVQLSRQRLFETQKQVSSGLRITRPADDPAGASRAMSLRTSMDRNMQYRRNIDAATGDLATAESALGALTALLQRAQELTVSGANGAVGGPEREHIALEVAQLLSEALSVGNTTHGGRYLFAGHQTSTPPFVPDDPAVPTAIAYAGDTGLRQREIALGERVTVNITGDRVFPDVYSTLISLRDALAGDIPAGITAAVGQLSGVLDRVLEMRSELGSITQRVEAAEQRLLDEDMLAQSLVSQIEDADLAEQIVTLQTRETALQAALGAAGRALNLSLMEFLR